MKRRKVHIVTEVTEGISDIYGVYSNYQKAFQVAHGLASDHAERIGDDLETKEYETVCVISMKESTEYYVQVDTWPITT